MTPVQRELVQQAADSIAAARLLLDAGYAGYAAARAYYAMFYVAEAFLEGIDLSFSKHSAVIAAFGKHIVRSGQVPQGFHRYLLEGYDVRQAGDYGGPTSVTAEQATVQIRRAEEVLALAQQRLGGTLPPQPSAT